MADLFQPVPSSILMSRSGRAYFGLAAEGFEHDVGIGRWVVGQHGFQSARLDMVAGLEFREQSDAQARHRRRGERRAIIGFEATVRMERDDLSLVRQAPGFGTLHEAFVVHKVGRFCRLSPCLEIGRTGHKRPPHRGDPPRHKARVGKISHPDGSIETFADEVDEAIAIGGVDLQFRMSLGQFGKDRSELGRAEGQRCCEPEQAPDIAFRRQCVLRVLQFDNDPHCVLAKGRARFGQRGAARATSQQLRTQSFFEPHEAPTDDGLGQTEPPRRLRDASGFGNFDEASQVVQVKHSVPFSATQKCEFAHYLHQFRNTISISNSPYPIGSNGENDMKAGASPRSTSFEVTDSPARAIAARTRGHSHGPITRLMSPSDLGRVIKPFVFLDLFEGDMKAMAAGMGLHPHSGIATVTVFTKGDVCYDDPTDGQGTLTFGGVEWMRASGGVWHGKELSAGKSARMQGFQLWLAMPPHLENEAPYSQYIEAEHIQTSGPAHIVVGDYEGVSSPVIAPDGVNYLLIRLEPGEQWTYRPPEGHSVAWLAMAEGMLCCDEVFSGGDMIVFRPSEDPIPLTALGDEPAIFVLGSAVPHPHDLHLGYYSVHTSAEALARGERRIAELGRMLGEAGDRTTGSGSTPVFKGN